MPALLRETAGLLRLAGPIAAVALLNMGMSLTDAAMVARLGTPALAAVAAVSDLYSIVFFVASGFVLVLGPLVAEARGGDRPEEVTALLRAGLACAVVVALPAMALVWGAPALLAALGVAPELVAAGRGYAWAMGGTVALLVFAVLWRTVLAAHERPRVFVWFALAALPLNAAGNALLMHGFWGVPALGTTGAGLSSLLVAAFMAGGLGLHVALAPDLRRLGLFRRPWRAEPARVAALLRQGVPMGLGGLGEVGLFLLATPLVALFGAEAIAAHIIALRLTGTLYAIENSLGQAAAMRIAHALGSGDGALRRARVRAALLVAAGLGLAALVGLAVAAEPLAGLAAGPAQAQAERLLRTVAALHLPLAFGTVALGVLRGHKDWRGPMVIANATSWGIGLPLLAVLAFGLGLREQGVWLALTASAACAALCSGGWLRRVTAARI